MSIFIHDNFLSNDDLVKIQEQCLKQKFNIWKFDCGSPTRFLWSETWEDRDFINSVFTKIINQPYLKSNKMDEPPRIYTNLAPAGKEYEGVMHKDDGDLTVLFYPFDWDPQYEGGTKFEDGTTIGNKANRLLVYNSDVSHAAAAHYNFTSWRFTVVFKTTLYWSDSYKDIFTRSLPRGSTLRSSDITAKLGNNNAYINS